LTSRQLLSQATARVLGPLAAAQKSTKLLTSVKDGEDGEEEEDQINED
jgi:hypothetical protein